MVKIEVLGSGCANCQRLEVLARKAVAKLGIEAEVAHVTDIKEIMARGVMATPGLAVNGKIVLKGRVPAAAEVESLIKGAASSPDWRKS
jgi:small redox-active disulfide protein 2